MIPLFYIHFFFKLGVADVELASIEPLGLIHCTQNRMLKYRMYNTCIIKYMEKENIQKKQTFNISL